MTETFDGKSEASKLSSDLWLRAFNSLSDEDRRHAVFPQTGGKAIVKAVLTLAEEKQKEAQDRAWTYTRKNGEVIVLRHLFEKVVDSLAKFQDAASFLVSLDASGHAALPWAGIQFFLSIAVKDTKRWGAVLEGMEFVTREISYYGIFEVLYLRQKFDATHQLSEALVRAYSTILKYLCNARRYYEKNSLGRAISTAFSFDSQLDEIVSAIKIDREEVAHLKDLIDGQYNKELGQRIMEVTENQKAYQERLEWMLKDLAEPMEGLSAQLAIMQSKQDELLLKYQRTAKADQLPRLYNHLQPGKVPDYRELLKGLTVGTACWILRTGPVNEWIDGKKPILLISGAPGTGKSHLSTFLINDLRRNAMNAGCHNLVAYYYFNGRDNKTRSVLIALCTIVCELATEDEIFRMHAVEACDQSPAYATTTARAVWNDFLAAEFGATSTKQLFIVLDGIDEAEMDEVKELVTLLSESVQQRLRIQVLLVGRPEMENVVKNDMEHSWVGVVQISSKFTFDDIKSVSENRFNTYIRIQQFKALKQKVITTIAQRADGMFLWVDLVYKELQGLSPQRLRLALDNLPDGSLNGLYDRIFSRIEADIKTLQQLGQLKELFCWTAHFKEPLSLYYLNQIIRLATKDELFDAEWTIDKTCASLLLLVKTGEVLFDETQLDATASAIDMESAAEDLEDEDKLLEDEERENEAIDDEEERHQARHREIFVNLRHTSLGDYLKRSDLESSAILLTGRDARAHVVLTSLSIICKGPNAPQELWLYLMTTLLSQLRSVDENNVSEEETKRIVEYLLEIFLSEPLQRHIVKFHKMPDGYPLLSTSGDSFFFGANTDLQHENRVVIQKWFKKADCMASAKLNDEASLWVKSILEEPLKLLIPLTKTSIREWLACDGDAFEMYWRFRFAWLCIISTDLVPACTAEAAQLSTSDLDFLGTDPFIFVAGVLGERKSMESSFQIARTISFGGHQAGSRNRQLSKLEYQNAIEMAQKQGSQEMVRKILLDQISAFVSTRVMNSDEQAHEYIEKFLVLDQSNALVYASLGVVRYQDGDYPGAIQAFQTSLDLEDGMTTHEYSRSLVAIALLETMFAMNDFAGIMSQIQRYGPSTSISWIRESLDHTDFQRGLMYAARKTGKTDLLIECYQQGINNEQFSENDLQAMKNSAPEKLAQLKLRLRSRNLATSSMFRCYLAWLHQECLGQYEEAIDLWKIAFFQRPEFLKLGKVYSSAFTTDIVPDMFARFSQLLYDKALQQDGEIDEPTVALLERLSQRHEAFRNLERDSLELTDQRNVNLLLARLYWRCGRKEEAQKLLDEQFQRVMDLLRDDIGWNDTYGYQLLARALLTNSQPQNAELAASLTRFFEHGYNAERNDAADDDLYEIEPTCAGWCTFSGGRQVEYDSPLYACTTCANIVFCERCYQTLRAPETAEDKIFVCNSDHEFLRSPAEGLERVANGMITMNGKTQSFAAWLDEVQKEWKTGLYFRM